MKFTTIRLLRAGQQFSTTILGLGNFTLLEEENILWKYSDLMLTIDKHFFLNLEITIIIALSPNNLLWRLYIEYTHWL